MNAPAPPLARPGYTLWQLGRYMLRLGAVGFGGPVALVGYMDRDLVERRQWIPEADFREGLALAQLAPGPLAAQLAIYLGYVHYRIPGATLAGLAFVLPSFLMVVALGWAYVRFGGLPWMQAVFYGVGAAVVGVIVISAGKLTEKSIGRDPVLWAIYLFTILPAPYFKRYGKLPSVVAFVDGITAAAIGAITGSVVVIARRAIVDIPTVLIAAVSIGMLWRFKKLPEPLLVAGAAMSGLLIYPLSH